MAPADTPMEPVKGQTGLAWVVVLAIVGVLTLFIVVSAFSQDNAPASVDGTTATTTHYELK